MPQKNNLSIGDDATGKAQKGPDWEATLKKRFPAGENVKHIDLPIPPKPDTGAREALANATDETLLQQRRETVSEEESENQPRDQGGALPPQQEEQTQRQQQSQMRARQPMGPDARSPLQGRGQNRPQMRDTSTLQSVTSPAQKKGWSPFKKLLLGGAVTGGGAAGLIYFLT